MRTTIALDPDIEAAVERLRRRGPRAERGGQFARSSLWLVPTKQAQPYAMSPRPMGAKIDVDNIGEVLDLLDEPLMLLDANILLYATDAGSYQHQPEAALLTSLMNGTRRVGLPWQTIGAFVRISTNPRAYASPATGPEAWAWVRDGSPETSPGSHPPPRRRLACTDSSAARYRSPAIPFRAAMLAALAIEHGLELWSTDTDFARFPGLRWRNPLTTG